MFCVPLRPTYMLMIEPESWYLVAVSSFCTPTKGFFSPQLYIDSDVAGIPGPNALATTTLLGRKDDRSMAVKRITVT
jgi:hypothetical protein